VPCSLRPSLDYDNDAQPGVLWSLRASLTKMTERVALLETDRHSMRGTMDGLREELRVLSKGLDKFEVSKDG
jgi:hypothetical protein